MLRQLCVVMGVCGFVVGCSGADSEETPAASESLEVLRRPAPECSSPAVRSALVRAASRLCDLQADRVGDSAGNGLSDDDPDDGAWDWVLAPSSVQHSIEASPENLYGATGLGVWAGLRVGGEGAARFRSAILNVGLGAQLNPAVDSPPDFVFLVQASEVLHAHRYAVLARERYDARVASAGDATALALAIRDAHHAAGIDGLIAYDLAWLALGALALDAEFPRNGYRADFANYVSVVIEDLASSTPAFDYRDAREAYYVQGLGWSLLVASWAHGSHALFQELRSRLLAEQLPSGAFPYNADFPDPHLQSTAHALTALSLARKTGWGQRAIDRRAAMWLMAQQADNGGWAYSATEEYPLLNGEIALAVYLSETVLGSREGVVPDEGPGRVGFALTRASELPPLAAPQ